MKWVKNQKPKKESISKGQQRNRFIVAGFAGVLSTGVGFFLGDYIICLKKPDANNPLTDPEAELDAKQTLGLLFGACFVAAPAVSCIVGSVFHYGALRLVKCPDMSLSCVALLVCHGIAGVVGGLAAWDARQRFDRMTSLHRELELKRNEMGPERWKAYQEDLEEIRRREERRKADWERKRLWQKQLDYERRLAKERAPTATAVE